jgi:hypothetical protein
VPACPASWAIISVDREPQSSPALFKLSHYPKLGYWLDLGLIRPLAKAKPATDELSPDGWGTSGLGPNETFTGVSGGRL